MSEILTKYKTIKQTISGLISQKSRIEGKKEQILSDLQEKFSILNIEDAQASLEKMSEEHSVMEMRIAELVKELEKIIAEAGA